MPERAHYSRAPIVEAVIDLRVTRTREFTVEDLEPIRDAIADQYPRQESLHARQVNIPAGQTAQVESFRQQTGFRFSNQTGQRVLQARVDGFAFSVLAPYDRWETFRDEARRLWDLYRSVTNPTNITRVALRYINRIDIPIRDAEVLRLEDYLTLYPEIPPNWPYQNLWTFFIQMQVLQEDLGCMLAINQATAEPPDPETTSILLDLDLFREQYEAPWHADEAVAWEFLERLHVRKNEYFEASITDETRGLIE
jgi:uncharacterized protein (TIGR04255 family)